MHLSRESEDTTLRQIEGDCNSPVLALIQKIVAIEDCIDHFNTGNVFVCIPKGLIRMYSRYLLFWMFLQIAKLSANKKIDPSIVKTTNEHWKIEIISIMNHFCNISRKELN